MLPCISIIIPVYNTKKYLKQCIDSVIMQMDRNDEIILVNDGSTDGSGQICEFYQTTYVNIKLLRQPNMGQGVARNRGIQASERDYVIFLDSDDYWENSTLEIVKRELQNQFLDIIYFDAKCVYDTKDMIKKAEFGNTIYNRSGKISEEVLKGEDFFENSFPDYFRVQPCLAVYRRKFLLEKGVLFQEGVFFEDNLFSFKAVLEASKVKFLPIKLYIRRYRTDSTMTSAITIKKIEDYVSVLEEICSYILQIKYRYSGKLLWKIYYFAYKIVDNFFSFSRKCTDVIMDKADMERLVYKNIFQLTQNDDSDCGIALGMFLRSFEYVKGSSYGESLIKEVFTNKGYRQLTLDQLYDYYIMKYKQSIDQKLRNLPVFDHNLAVGIYGAGKYTECLLKECKTLGSITEKIWIIDSFEKQKKYFMECYPLINVREVSNKVDKVIIASYKNERDMMKMAKEYLNKEIEIILLHEDEIGPIFWNYVYR